MTASSSGLEAVRPGPCPGAIRAEILHPLPCGVLAVEASLDGRTGDPVRIRSKFRNAQARPAPPPRTPNLIVPCQDSAITPAINGLLMDGPRVSVRAPGLLLRLFPEHTVLPLGDLLLRQAGLSSLAGELTHTLVQRNDHRDYAHGLLQCTWCVVSKTAPTLQEGFSLRQTAAQDEVPSPRVCLGCVGSARRHSPNTRCEPCSLVWKGACSPHSSPARRMRPGRGPARSPTPTPPPSHSVQLVRVVVAKLNQSSTSRTNILSATAKQVTRRGFAWDAVSAFVLG